MGAQQTAFKQAGDAYLNKFSFRFNGRSSSRRGLLFYRLLQRAVPPPTADRSTRPTSTLTAAKWIPPFGAKRERPWRCEGFSRNGAEGGSTHHPVDAFRPCVFGLYNVTGNVWEWTADWFDPAYLARDSTHNHPAARLRDSPRRSSVAPSRFSVDTLA